MTVVVSFMKPGWSVNAPMYGACRARENLALDATTTATAREGELVLVGNGETDMIAVAFGTTPNAAATAETGATSAGMPVGPGQVVGLSLPAGAKVNVKALS